MGTTPENETAREDAGVVYRVCPTVTNDDLNPLFAASWSGHVQSDFETELRHSLTYLCAFHGRRLIGFVRLAWDGGVHAFLLDPTVHPEWRRRGIGLQLVQRSVAVAQARGIEWVHVEYEPTLREFFEKCGFRPTEAGLIHLGGGSLGYPHGDEAPVLPGSAR